MYLPNQFLEDKLVEEISSRKKIDDCEFLLEKLDKQQKSRKTAGSTQYLEDKQSKINHLGIRSKQINR